MVVVFVSDQNDVRLFRAGRKLPRVDVNDLVAFQPETVMPEPENTLRHDAPP